MVWMDERMIEGVPDDLCRRGMGGRGVRCDRADFGLAFCIAAATSAARPGARARNLPAKIIGEHIQW